MRIARKNVGTILLGVLIIAVFFFGPIPLRQVSATQVGSQDSSSCKNYYRGKWKSMAEHYSDYLNSCTGAGVSFAYFVYDVENPPDISMGPTTERSGKRVKIPGSACGSTGGFLHFGITDYKYGKSWTDGATTVSVNGLGSLGNIKMEDGVGHLDEIFEPAGIKDMRDHPLNQIITVKDIGLVAHLDSYVDSDTAHERYEEWLQYSGDEDIWGKNLNSFCWGPSIGDYTATYTGTTSSSGDSGNVTNKDGKFSITFEHFIERTDDTSFNPPNGNSWNTSVSGGIGSTKYGTFNGRARTRVASDKVTGTLLPGEKRTFCPSITYQSSISSDGSSTTATSSPSCRTVWRDEATCFGREYGVDNGKNYGKISLNKNNRSWIDAQPNNPEGFSESMREASVEAWTRPNDGVKFKTEMCEGAELANQYHNINKNILYGLTATDVQYLGGLSPHEWSNNGLKSRNNAGTGIFGGSYTNQTQTPHNGQFSITESHVGKSFNQTLAWTDLWMSGGAVVDSHNPGGKTWQNVAIATVHTPYNYTTGVTLKSNNLKYGLAGTNISDFELSLRRNARKNPKVTEDSSSYVTKTKPTKFQVFSFKVASGVPEASVKLNDEYVRGDGSGIACGNYLSSAGGCEVINRASGDKVLSGDSTILNNSTDKQISVSIPDNAEIGSKICLVGAIWPADSHDLPTSVLDRNSDQAPALKEDGAYWHLSEPSCFTVAKKPTLQVRNSGAYAGGNIDTAVSRRAGKAYGSWADYELIAGSGIRGMASGAMFWGAGRESVSTPSCYYSPLSITNVKCSSAADRNVVGNAPESKGAASYPGTILSNVKSRFTRSDANKTTSLQEPGFCQLNIETGEYEALGGRTDFNCLDNGTNYTYLEGDAHTPSGDSWLKSVRDYRSTTWVTYVTGTLYIDQNMFYGDPIARENTTYSDITDIAQRILIAKNIKISPNVTHLDAWLLAEDSIDTCAPADGKLGTTHCDQQLTVTGPVIAKRLSLNRSFGGNGGVQSNSQAAEVFRLSPMTYLWSYAQSTRSLQAPTTYQRELPTRY